jgi:UDP-glucose 4-epimerase
MKVLVTGSAGFLGRVVVATLIDAGCQVVAGTRRPDRLQPLGAHTVHLDVADQTGLRRAIVDSQCDAVVHLAALTRMRESTSDPLAFYDVNTVGTLNVMHAIDELARAEHDPLHVVFASTNAVYGSQPAIPQREDDPTNPENPYAASKLFAEGLIRQHTTTGRSVGTVLRFSNIAGGAGVFHDEDGHHIIPRLLKAIEDGTPVTINGDGEATRDYIHVIDAADAIHLALLARPSGGNLVLNIGSGAETSVRAIIRAVERVAGRPAQMHHRAAGPEAKRVVMSIDRATTSLGWKPKHSSVDQLVTDAWSAAHLAAHSAR